MNSKLSLQKRLVNFFNMNANMKMKLNMNTKKKSKYIDNKDNIEINILIIWII